MLSSEQVDFTVPTIKKPKFLDPQADSEAGPPLARRTGGHPNKRAHSPEEENKK